MRIVSGLLLSILLASPTAVPADNKPAASPLAGTWTLKSAYDLHKDGSKSLGFGSQPKGMLIVDRQGDYSLQVFRSDEATFSVDDHNVRKDFKPSELASAHYGRISLDSTAHTVTFHIDRSYIQRWNGTVQVRPYTMSSDVLSYQVPAQPGSDSVAVSVWQRVPDQATAVAMMSSEAKDAFSHANTDVVMPR